MDGTGEVEIIVVGDDPSFAGGKVVGRAASSLCVEPATELPATVGSRVAVRDADDGDWMHGEVMSIDDGRYLVRIDRVVPRDLREFPRMYGAIQLEYQPIPAGSVDDLVAPWQEEGEAPTDVWLRPDPFMNFSASGLQFDVSPPPRAGDHLLMAFTVPTDDTRWRAIARVVRVAPIPPEEIETQPFADGASIPTHRIAVHFTHVPGGALRALMRFTERIQQTLLGQR